MELEKVSMKEIESGFLIQWQGFSKTNMELEEVGVILYFRPVILYFAKHYTKEPNFNHFNKSFSCMFIWNIIGCNPLWTRSIFFPNKAIVVISKHDYSWFFQGTPRFKSWLSAYMWKNIHIKICCSPQQVIIWNLFHVNIAPKNLI